MYLDVPRCPRGPDLDVSRCISMFLDVRGGPETVFFCGRVRFFFKKRRNCLKCNVLGQRWLFSVVFGSNVMIWVHSVRISWLLFVLAQCWHNSGLIGPNVIIWVHSVRTFSFQIAVPPAWPARRYTLCVRCVLGALERFAGPAASFHHLVSRRRKYTIHRLWLL